MRTSILVLFALMIGEVRCQGAFAGEITYTHVSDFTYEILVTYYTCTDFPTDLPEIQIEYGDGSTETIARTSIVDLGPWEGCCPTRINSYQTTHAYAGPGVYVISSSEYHRMATLVNVPNSNSIPYYIQSTLVISPTTGNNNSAQFLNNATDIELEWITLIHDPQAFDPDGDSLSFELVAPLGSDGMPIPGYFPPPPSTTPGYTWLDPNTGIFHWNAPQQIGAFSIAIRATEWRWQNGIPFNVGRVTRDMTLCVTSLPTGIDELPGASAITFYPTITDGPLFMSNSAEEKINLTVIDASGRSIASLTLPVGEQHLDMSHLPSGIYTLRSDQGAIGRFVRN